MLLKQFFELLRSGLWGHPADVSLFAGGSTDWDAIYLLSRRQTVVALVFDGMQTLPGSMHPHRELLIRWCAQVVRIEKSNAYLNTLVAEVFGLYRDAGLKPVLLKGQGIAALYGNPAHRQAGDIDVYLGKEQASRANEVMRRNGGVQEGSQSPKHMNFVYKEIRIENHRIAERPANPAARRSLTAFVDKYLTDTGNSVTLGGAEIEIPSLVCNSAYILIHALYHFFREGIGLRQICDWVHVLNSMDKDAGMGEVQRLFADMKITQGAAAFAYIGTAWLGLPGGKLSFIDIGGAEEMGEKLLRQVLRDGNFGQYSDMHADRPRGYFSGKAFSFVRKMGHMRRNREFIQRERGWYIPYSIKTSVKKIISDIIRGDCRPAGDAGKSSK
jgi:hypothetical protein